jgi:hypothetical protein
VTALKARVERVEKTTSRAVGMELLLRLWSELRRQRPDLFGRSHAQR